MKMWSMLSTSKQRAAVALLFLMIIGMVLETIGVGLIVPLIVVLLQDDIATKYPIIQPVIDYLGNPSQNMIIVYSMLFLLGVYTVKNLFLVVLEWRKRHFAYTIRTYLAYKLFNNYLHQPYTFHLQHNSAQLIRNISGEVSLLISYGLNSVLTVFTEGLVLLGVLGMLIVVEPVGAILVIGVVGLSSVGFHWLLRSKVVRWGKDRQYYDGMIIQHLQQGLGGVKDVKIFGREESFLNGFDLHNKKSAKIAQWEQTLQVMPRLWIELVAVVGLVILVLSVISKGDENANNIVPILGLFAAAAFRLLPSLSRIMSALQAFRFSVPVIETLNKDLNLQLPVRKLQAVEHQGSFHEKIKLANVDYTYPSASTKTLMDISITVNHNESVGLIGTSGAGKSTLVDVILGLLTPDSGKVIVDKNDIANNTRDWQNQIGYVPQSVYLTDSSLKNNVAFGVVDNEIDEDAVWRAIQSAQLGDFVASQPEGLEVIVGERGVRLSGGQRQRIGIARALYHNPSIIVLDEATSSLDIKTEQGVMETINALHGRKTLIIIAHRISTVEHCDRLYRLENGRVVEEVVNGAI
jgi:ABC-type multidrug transport system fused ATPase/permease subunit